ncbi:MAG TPA: hypothetical protein VN675_01095 [Burkholderiales bacterium]|nr:hypothetical protein [Burkholderiales bacterium]
MKPGVLLLALCSFAAAAQDLREKALEQEKRALEQQRQQQEKERSVVEHQRRELASPVAPRKRDERACENARISYQTTCGSPTAPKYRNPGCRDAEIFLRENC